MYKLIALVVAVVAVASQASGQAHVYPPGVDPTLCPNYPYCDSTPLGLYSPIAYSAYSAYPSHLTSPYTFKYPAGVHPATCPNYPFCH